MARRRPVHPDLARLTHMIDAVAEALRFARGRTRKDLGGDRMLTLALIKDIEIAGEAASRVSEGFKRKHPAVPWRAVVATRNRLIHGYFEVDLDIVWRTIESDLPPLLASLRRIAKGRKRGRRSRIS